MRRVMALLAMAAACVAPVASAQAARTWTDPSGALQAQLPRGYPVQADSGSTAQVLVYVAGAADYECMIYGISRPATAATPPGDVHHSIAQPYTAVQWTQLIGSMRYFKPGSTITSSSVDTTAFWPVQRAVVNSGGDTIQAGVTVRPGRDIYTFCQSFDGRDRSAEFGQIIRNVGTPQDAALQSAIQPAAAAPAAAPAPAAPPTN